MAGAHADLAPPMTLGGTLATGSGARETRGVARGGLANVAGSALAGGTGVVVTWIVARSLGQAEAGAFFSATAAFVLAGGLAKLGTGTGLVYWPARLRATGRSHLLGACLRTGLTPVVVFSLALAVAMWIAAPEIAHGVRGVADALRVLALFIPLQALTDVLLTVTRGYRSMRPTVLIDRVLRSCLQILAVGAIGLFAASSLPAFAMAWAVPYLPVTILSAYAARSAYLAGRPADATSPRAERRQLRREFWLFTGPRALAAVAQLALQRVDVLLVAALSGLGAAAVYAVAGRFVILIQFANQGISQSVQPRLAEALSTGDRDAANRLYQVATGWLVLITWPVNLLVILFAPHYLRFFGDEYTSGTPVVRLLAAAMLVATGCGMVDMVLSMAGRTSLNLGNVLVALAVTIGLDVLLIPRWGAIGAAAGLAGAMLANNLLPLIQVFRGARLHPFGPGTRAAALLSAGCFGVLPRAVTALTGDGPAGLALAATAAIATFGAGAWLLRERLELGAFTRRNPQEAS
ncbi:Membrane protein involved in the export of O-antigen and teichoic acid [Actinoplanes cyaneus]|nr:Membrane protein involved in the export of O-antigen and teichoic acid [Actinoplanes cyaneus]